MRQATPALLWGLSLAIVVETFVLHLVLVAAHPVLAWTSSAIGISSVLWLVVKALRRSPRTARDAASSV
jgi:hypothetical protein